MKKMTKAMLMTALILGSVQWGGTPVHASELDTFTLEEYVVTAARTETKLVDTPANISVVTAEQIESRHYADVAEVLKDVPGAVITDSGIGASNKSVYINGDDRVLILVDGRRMGLDMGGGSGRTSYDLNQLPNVGNIERIEVLKGAGGALYGSEAVGGVLNIITKKIDKAYGKVSMGFGSNGTEDMRAMYSFKKNKTGVSLSASKYKQDYYKYRDYATDTTKRWPLPSNYENEKVSLKVEQELNNGNNITVGYDYSKFDGLSPYSISNKDYGYDSSYIDKQTDNLYAKYDWTINGKDQGYIQFYHNELEYFNQGGMEEKSTGFDIQQALTTSDTNKLVVGASYRDSDVTNVGKYDVNMKNSAIFLNDTWEFYPTWIINAGIRYDDNSKSGDETTFSAGLNKKFNDNSHAYINWGQVFRAPTTDDLFYPWMGNADLVPETGETWTVGYATKIADKTDVNISYFESDLKDAIRYNPNNGWKCENIDKQDKRGIELSVNHPINDNLDLVASYTYTRIENNKDGAGFVRDANYMPNMYRLGLRYNYDKWNADMFLRYANGGCTGINPNNGNVPYLENSYLTLDVAVTYQAMHNLKVFAKGYNLFNESYAEYAGIYNGSYDYPAQSRRFLIGAEYSF